MFAFHCPREDRRTLVFASDLDGTVRVDGGLAVAFHCGCGWRGVWLTGSTGVGVVVPAGHVELVA